MLPYLGRGDRGAERGVKLALIGRQMYRAAAFTILTPILSGPAGIKEGLYDNEALSAYLLYRLNALNRAGTFMSYPKHIASRLFAPCLRA
jgi:hypothetical protein